MPRWLRRYFFTHSLEFHLVVSLAAAVLLRGLCAFYVYGPQALDDFNHAITPAYHMLKGEPLKLPDYRSHLLIWILAGLMQLAQTLGLNTPLGQLRLCYAGLGLLSLSAVAGTYLMAKAHRSRLAGAAALYLIALFPLMPFVATRTFGEAVASGLVALGLGLLEHARMRHRQEAENPVDRTKPSSTRISRFSLGFAVLGLATLFRFQVGLIYLSSFVILSFLCGGPVTLAGLAAGVWTLATSAVIDHLSGKNPFETLFQYMIMNSGGGREFGVHPWYNTWLLFGGLGLMPLSLVFWPQLKSLWRRHWFWLLPMLIFTLAHSLIPHKEERFLYPILALELWALATLWAGGALRNWPKRIFAPIVIYILTPLSLAVSLINTQEGAVRPMADISSNYRDALILYYNVQMGVHHFKEYFLRSPMSAEHLKSERLSASEIDQTLLSHPENGAVVILTSDRENLEKLRLLSGVTTARSRCHELRTAQSWTDRILYTLNPKMNLRRQPTWYLTCERRQDESPPSATTQSPSAYALDYIFRYKIAGTRQECKK